MRPRLTYAVAASLSLAVTGAAWAQTAARSHRAQAAPPPAVAADAMRYLSGVQAMVGLHAPSIADPPRDAHGRPMLALRSVNRGEFLSLPASRDDGGFDALDLDRAAHLLRAASGDEHPVDPRTIDLVYRIQAHFEVPEIRVVSGYRVPVGRSHSNHGKGRAMDIIVPGIADEDVAKFAREMGFVGVGVYPRSQFVHVDIRPRSYFWIDFSGPHMKNRERGILADLASRSDAAATARGQAAIEPYALVTDVDAALRSRGVAVADTAPDDDDDETDSPE